VCNKGHSLTVVYDPRVSVAVVLYINSRAALIQNCIGLSFQSVINFPKADTFNQGFISFLCHRKAPIKIVSNVKLEGLSFWKSSCFDYQLKGDFFLSSSCPNSTIYDCKEQGYSKVLGWTLRI